MNQSENVGENHLSENPVKETTVLYIKNLDEGLNKQKNQSSFSVVLNKSRVANKIICATMAENPKVITNSQVEDAIKGKKNS